MAARPQQALIWNDFQSWRYVQKAVIACCLLFVLVGCAIPNQAQTVVTGNSPPVNATQPQSEDGTLSLIPPNVLSIPGLPVPSGAVVSLSDTVIVGADEAWTGQVVMTSQEYQPIQLVQFMRQTMPQYGWVETAIVRSRRTSITYVNRKRYATVRVQPLDRGSEIDVVVSPAGPTNAELQRQGAYVPVPLQPENFRPALPNPPEAAPTEGVTVIQPTN